MSAWLNDFESIGDNCEFGFVQSQLNNDASALLRWTLSDSIEATSNCIRSGFDGVFAFENLRPAEGGTMVRDITAGMAFHTSMRSERRNGVWQFVSSHAERRRIHSLEMAKFLHLRQKFRLSLIKGERIYVAKRNENITEREAAALYGAIASHGRGRLLFITGADESHAPGSVELLDTHVARGWIDRFAPYSRADHVSLECWETLLRKTAAMFGGRPSVCTPAKPFVAEAQIIEQARSPKVSAIAGPDARLFDQDQSSTDSLAHVSAERTEFADDGLAAQPSFSCSRPLTQYLDFVTGPRANLEAVGGNNPSDAVLLEGCDPRQVFLRNFLTTNISCKPILISRQSIKPSGLKHHG